MDKQELNILSNWHIIYNLEILTISLQIDGKVNNYNG